MIDLKDVKKRVEDYEFFHSGVKFINGAYVRAVNVRVSVRFKKVFADVKLVKQLDGVVERFNDCEYSFEALGVE